MAVDKMSTIQVDNERELSGCKLFKLKANQYPFVEHNDDRLKMHVHEIIERDIKFEDCVLDQEGKIEATNIKGFWVYVQKWDKLTSLLILILTDYSPFYIWPFTVSAAEKPVIDKELDNWLK